MNEQSLELAAREAAAELAVQLGEMGDRRDLMITTMPVTDRESGLAAYELLSGDAQPLSEHLGETIEIEHYCAHSIELTDPETAEIIPVARIVIQTPAGERYECVSAGVFRSIQRLEKLIGRGPWEPPVSVQCRAKKTNRGFRVLTLDVVRSVGPAEGRKK